MHLLIRLRLQGGGLQAGSLQAGHAGVLASELDILGRNLLKTN